MNESKDEARFWSIADDLLSRTGVTKSTMMGFPCLRFNGSFFACWDRREERLVAKLDAASVTAMIDAGRGEGFAPNGQRFREWIAVPPSRRRSWPRILDEAFEHARTKADLRHGFAAEGSRDHQG